MSENKMYKRKLKTGWKVFFAIVIVFILLLGNGAFSLFKDDVSYSSGIARSSNMSDVDSAFGVDSSGSSSEKWTKSADYDIESIDFDKTHNEIIDILDKYDARLVSNYVGVSSSYYSRNNGQRYFRVRAKVNAEKLDELVSKIEDLKNINIVSKSVYADNVTDDYEDIQGRIESIKIRIERYEELLKSATEMSDIASISESLDEAQSDLETYQRMLDVKSEDVVYSEVSIYVDETNSLSSDKTAGLGHQLVHAFKTGVHNFVNSAASLIVYIVGHLLYILVIIVVLLLIRKFRLVRKAKAVGHKISDVMTDEIVYEVVSDKDKNNTNK